MIEGANRTWRAVPTAAAGAGTVPIRGRGVKATALGDEKYTKAACRGGKFLGAGRFLSQQ
jgi:hypothetical protein